RATHRVRGCEMTLREQQLICQAHQLGEPVSSRPLGGTRNRNFVLATTTGDWFVRHRYSGYSQPDRIAFDHAALKYLCEQAVPVVAPRAMPDGKAFFQDHDQTWEVFPFI